MRGVDIDPCTVETNIVRFRLQDLSAAAFVDACFAEGVHMLPAGRTGVRAVTHLDVGDGDIDYACAVIESVLAAGVATIEVPPR